MGQSSGVLFKEVSAYLRCPLNKGITTCIHKFEPVLIGTILPTVNEIRKVMHSKILLHVLYILFCIVVAIIYGQPCFFLRHPYI